MKLRLLRDPSLGRVYYQMKLDIPSWRLWIHIPGKGDFTYHSLGQRKNRQSWERVWNKLI